MKPFTQRLFTLVISVGLWAGARQAHAVESLWGEAELYSTVTIFFSVPAAEVETNLQRSLKNLEKMECRDTGEVCQKPPKRALRKLTRTLRANETYYDVFWWPPTPPRQRVSQGGEDCAAAVVGADHRRVG